MLNGCCQRQHVAAQRVVADGAFGARVWIFQDGHLGAFGTTATGTLVASVPVLLFCLAFGLSMDYEVFLISRIRESWLYRQDRADNDESVALGLARTGRVVTAAALLMAVRSPHWWPPTCRSCGFSASECRWRCWWTPRWFGCC